MSATVARMLARHDAAEDARKDALAYRYALPTIDPGVRRPFTLYHASCCHDSMLIVYEPRGGRASRSEMMVPGTYREPHQCG